MQVSTAFRRLCFASRGSAVRVRSAPLITWNVVRGLSTRSLHDEGQEPGTYTYVVPCPRLFLEGVTWDRRRTDLRLEGSRLKALLPPFRRARRIKPGTTRDKTRDKRLSLVPSDMRSRRGGG